MSALDQAFIKAFAKEPSAAARRASHPETPPSALRAPLAAEEVAIDELYDAGTFYRVDIAAENAVPPTHIIEQKIPRRLQRRGASRLHAEPAEPAPAPAPAPVEPNPYILPPRRHWSRSMLDIVRQLARLDDKHTPENELPPEIIFTDPPEPEPAPAAVPDEQNVANEKAEAAEEEFPTAPQAIASLWSVGEVIAPPSVVELADLETWLALPIAPAVACEASLAGAFGTIEPSAPAAEPASEPAAEAEAPEPKAKRKFRIDGAHTRVPAPHAPPAAPAEDVETSDEKVDADSEAKSEQEVAAEEATTAPAVAASEESPAEASPAPAPEPVVATNTVPKRPYIPLWEVDRFTWPAICDKLMSDPNGYFATASNKLLNVVRGGLKVLGITGSRRGEGRTTLALCLARAAAQAGIHVALLDADFGRPQLASMLGLETAYGWQEAAIGKIPLSEAAVKSLADRLTVLPLEMSAATADLSLADPRVTATLRATAATFDLVIVDLGPLSPSSEPLFPPGEKCPLDGAIVVRDMRYALLNESRAIGDRLYDAGIEAVGIAENFVTEPELALL
jgi:Mrp family chromosome partitioning ATPase